MPLSLDGFCAHHEGQSHGIDWYCKQYFYIRLIYLNRTIHLQEGKTGRGWMKQLCRQREATLIIFFSWFNFKCDNQRIRQPKLSVITQKLLSPRGFSRPRWKYLHLISRVGRRFLGVLREMRWGCERSCRTAQCDSKSEDTPPDGAAWNKRKQGDETQTQTSCGQTPPSQTPVRHRWRMASLHCHNSKEFTKINVYCALQCDVCVVFFFLFKSAGRHMLSLFRKIKKAYIYIFKCLVIDF